MSRYTLKTMYLEKPKRLIIWNGGSIAISMCLSKYAKHKMGLSHLVIFVSCWKGGTCCDTSYDVCPPAKGS